MMKILQILADGDPGGGTTTVLDLMKDLKGKNFDELYLITQSNSYALQTAKRLNIHCFGLDFFSKRIDLSLRKKIEIIISKVSPDIIHVHGSRAGFYLKLPNGKKDYAVIYHVHGYHFLRRTFVKKYLGLLAERQINKKVDSTVFVCQNDLNLAKKWNLLPYNKNHKVIYNGIDISNIPKSKNTNKKKIGFLGRLEHVKNPMLVLEVARLLVPEGYYFKLIGGGSLEGKIRSYINEHNLNDKVELTGVLPREEALRELQDIKVLMFPSLGEGLPLAPIEAMQMGIPVIAANVDGVPEIIETDVNGILIDDYSPQSYAKAIRNIDDDKRKQETIIENAQRTVHEKFTREQVVKNHIELYAKVLKKY